MRYKQCVRLTRKAAVVLTFFFFFLFIVCVRLHFGRYFVYFSVSVLFAKMFMRNALINVQRAWAWVCVNVCVFSHQILLICLFSF